MRASSLRVYDLQPACGRRDRTTANGHWTVTEDGLFQFGHRKDQRPDLAQVQIMVSALAPLGLPVATDVVPGQRADAPLYSLAITLRRGAGGSRSAIARWGPWRRGHSSRREATTSGVRCRRPSSPPGPLG